MIKDLSVIGFIPARGGSKTLPNKNILPLNEKPLIAYTIEAARSANICDEILVSTDSRQIRDVACNGGASVPFLRPEDISRDSSQMIEVVAHTLEWLSNQNRQFDIFLYLQPTSPLRSAKDILKAFDVFFSKEADHVISVRECPFFMGRVNTLPSDHNMKTFINRSTEYSNRQKGQNYYEVNGAIIISKLNVLKMTKSWYNERSFAYVMDRRNGLDIDDRFDFELAEFLLKKSNES